MTDKTATIAQFDEAQLKRLHQMLNSTLSTVLPDILQNCGPRKNSIPQKEAIEVVLDADYLETYGSGYSYDRKGDEKELVQRFRTLPYSEQVKFAKTVLKFKRYGM